MGPIVFIHGAGLSSDSWQYQTDFFANSVALDLPGHGRSTVPAHDTVAGYAGWLGEQIRRTGAEPVVLVGHSMGSLIALETAARNQDMVAGLVLIATAAEMPVHPDLLEAASANDTTAAAMVIKWSMPRHSGHGRPRKWVLQMSDEFMTAAADGVLIDDLTACNSYADALAMAARVRCPTLLLLGENDVMTRPAAAQPLAAALVDARIVVIEKVGHMLQLERADEINEAINLFLTID